MVYNGVWIVSSVYTFSKGSSHMGGRHLVKPISIVHAPMEHASHVQLEVIFTIHLPLLPSTMHTIAEESIKEPLG